MFAAAPAVAGWPLGAAALATHGGIHPPVAPMVFTRRLVRQLGVDAQGIFTRSYRIRFVPTESGFQVTGDARDVEVIVPPQLEGLARLERGRADRGPFPLDLDAKGRILSARGPTPLGDPAREAIDRAIAMVGDRRGGEDAETFLRRLGNLGHSLLADIPVTLFAPGNTELARSEDLAAPDGMAGKLEVFFRSQACSQTGLLQSAERRVVTTVGGSTRESSETFLLEPDAPDES